MEIKITLTPHRDGWLAEIHELVTGSSTTVWGESKWDAWKNAGDWLQLDWAE